MNRIAVIKSCLHEGKRILNRGVGLSKTRGLSTQDYKPGDSLPYGWTVVKTTSVPELSLPAVVHLAHKNCGAHLVHFSNPGDETNAFNVHFKTVPQDSTGIAHILEHVTLCGSEKYPVRDPFFKMLNRSLSTFMNAMTGPDYTLYPFATQNKKDFSNLLSVYLDAVFKPLLKETDFRQEGWRLSEENGKLVIKGVVFNEMKGAFADSQTIFGEAMLNSVLPSNTYDLTWQNLKDFHSQHYSPDNARFYTYGNIELEEHLKALSEYLPKDSPNETSKTVHEVPPERRWTTPIRKHISCPPDPSSTSNTICIAYLVSDIADVYENFVVKIISELLLEGPNAPFYRSLIENGLGTGFSPSSGFETSTRDTIFSVGLQGIAMNNIDLIESTIKKTFENVAKTGFDADRIEAILHRTELSLKKQVNNFGLNLIFGLAPTWNHMDDPFPPLHINTWLDKFRNDIKNPNFLTDKVWQHFINNPHKLILTMSPDEKFVAEREQVLSDLESRLVRSLTKYDRVRVAEIESKLQDEQSTKENDESIACLPSLQMEDIPIDKTIFKAEEASFGQFCVQPTNGVSYFRAMLATDVLSSDPKFLEYLPLFTMALTQMGAGEKFSFRQFDTVTDLYTGGLGASSHLSESPFNAAEIKIRGLYLSSYCLERNSDKMFGLWSDLFNEAFKFSARNSSAETSLESLVLRLGQLINMSAVDAVNGVPHSGHHYAMSHAASKISGLPAAQIREREGGISMVRFLSQLSKQVTETGTEVFDVLASMAKLLLRAENLRGIALNMTENHKSDFIRQTENFVAGLPKSGKIVSSGFENPNAEIKSRKTFVTTPFPVHYCALALPTVPYTHEDSAPLRILAKLLTAKFLLPEIREKGGAYGGGATSNNTSGLFTFYSYRDPNFESTFEAFEKSAEWISKSENFGERDITEAKLGVFQAVDAPILPGARGLGPFLTGISHETFLEHRRRLRDVTRDDLIRVSDRYLSRKGENVGVSVIGPESQSVKLDSTWNVEPLVD